MTLRDAPGGGELPPGFLDLPPAVYRDDPNWIPEDPAQVAGLFSSANPWFQQGSAHAFCVEGSCRAAAFRTRDLVVDGEPAAFFGYWDTVADADAERLVYDAVREWARAAGARRIYGPIDFSTALAYRIRIAGGDEMPVLGEPYNPPYYAERLEALGLSVHQRYLARFLDPGDVGARAALKVETLEGLKASGYRFELLTVDLWLEHAAELFEIANVVFAANFAFTPFSREEFDVLFDAAWAAKLHPELSLLVFGPEGDIAGFCLSYPHYAPLAVQAAEPERVRVKDLNYEQHGRLLAARGPETVVVKTGGTSPDHRRSGVAYAMITQICRNALDLEVAGMHAGAFKEDNFSRRMWEAGHRVETQHGLYAQDLAA